MSGLFATLKQAGKHIFSKSKYQGVSEWTPELGSFYDLNAVDIDGQSVSFSQYRGQVLLVINVASK